ncbi:MAG: phage holin family protein [Provencibacterium sp.]|jgi:toxin secretion/phage lysis holin|nr:phage holin family protein [Provencibacterium sp.]
MPKLKWLPAGAGAAGAALSAWFGGWSLALQTLCLFMAVDYITGLLVAGVFGNSQKSPGGRLESRAGWKGLCRKGATLLVVLVAARLDAVLDVSFVRDGVITAYLCNELISITENAGLMGVSLPSPISRALEALREEAKR